MGGEVLCTLEVESVKCHTLEDFVPNIHYEARVWNLLILICSADIIIVGLYCSYTFILYGLVW